jgi:hypothetical protein
MQMPKPANLYTPAEIRAGGWTAEARDEDGHLMTTHSEFPDAASLWLYFSECQREGWTATIWPMLARVTP